jgi:ATP-dependent Clp protease ATP-binding subunit ClpA
MDTYETRFDDRMRVIFRSTIGAARKSRLNRLSLSALMNELFLQGPDVFDVILHRLGIQADAFRQALTGRLDTVGRYSGNGIQIDNEVSDAFRGALRRARAQGREKITIEDTAAALGQNLDGEFLKILTELGADPYVVAKTVVDLLNKRDCSSRSAAESPESGTQIYRRGQTVRITSGPFAAMSARLETVDAENSEVTAWIKILGKRRTIMLSFSQVQKISFT